MDTSTLAIFLAATLALNLTPGPDMLYVIARSVGQGRKAGLISALGIGTGTFVHIFAVAFGLSTLLVSLPLAYEAVKLVGAAYLMFLGMRILLTRKKESGTEEVNRDSLRRIYRQGVITNVLNPKVALFFIAFIPQFVDQSRGPFASQVIFLGVLFNTSGVIVNSCVALLAGLAGNLLAVRSGLVRAQRFFTGGVFIALAVRIALLDRR
ncbi:MAG: LysE family translocator [Chloroflexi bacterium]|nr:LysE family translocator [Chloroflexota bacterium]